MWIRGLEVFHVEGADPATWQEAFARLPLTDPVASQKKSFGFVSQPDSDIIVDELEGRYAFLTVVATRHLPADAVEREATKRIEQLKQDAQKAVPEGEQPTNEAPSINREAIKDLVEADMLPHAPIRETRTPAVYCSRSQLLFVFGSNRQGNEAMQMAVREALGSFSAIPIRPRERVAALMADWIRGVDVPESLTVGDTMTLAAGEQGASITFKKQDLQSEEVINHLDKGAMISRLSLTWRGQLQFELDDKGQLLRIGPPGCRMKPQLAFVHWPEIMALLPRFTFDMLTLLDAELPASVLQDQEGASLAAAGQVLAPTSDEASGEIDLAEEGAGQGRDTSEEPQDWQGHRDDGSAPEPADFVPVVLPRVGAETDEVERMLNALDSHRPMKGIIVVQRPVDAYRAVYVWASKRELPITLMSMPDEISSDPVVLPEQVTAAVHVDEDEVAFAIIGQAQECGIEVIRMRQPGA